MNWIFRIAVVVAIGSCGASQIYAQDLCRNVSKIKSMPFHAGEPSDDAAYNALIKAGTDAVPCLIAKVGDATRMEDPRSVPRYAGLYTRVGDVALFVLNRIVKLDFVRLLPGSVQKEFETDGMWAYFRFMDSLQNRKWFQRRLRNWYRKDYRRDAHHGIG